MTKPAILLTALGDTANLRLDFPVFDYLPKI